MTDMHFLEEVVCDRRIYKEEIQSELLEERIMKDGIVKEGNVLKVDSFLNHQMDIRLLIRSVRNSRRDLREQRSTRYSL